MSKYVLVGAGVWVLATAGGYLFDPLLGTAVLVFGGILVLVAVVGGRGNGPTYQERELARARRRAAARQGNEGKRAKDRARYQAEQARRARRAARKAG